MQEMPGPAFLDMKWFGLYAHSPQQEEITTKDTKGMEKLLRESILPAPNDRAYRSKNRKARSLRFWPPQ